MVTAIVDTLNPKGGNGMIESIVFCAMVLALIVFNYTGVEVDPLFEKVMMALMGYMVGNNSKSKVSETDDGEHNRRIGDTKNLDKNDDEDNQLGG